MSGLVFFDVTFLAFGRDLRGIPQVIFQIVRLFRKDPAFHGVLYSSTTEVTRTFCYCVMPRDSPIIHPGLRVVLRSKVPQIVFY